MRPVTVRTESAEETQALGRRLGAAAEIGDMFLLHGALGTGKTTLTQGIAWGAGVNDYAHSPTFLLVHEYAGRIPLYHMDLYRLEGDVEVHDLGIEEMLTEGACVVEWAEKAAAVFSADHLDVEIDFSGAPDRRTITLTPQGGRFETLLSQVHEAHAQ